ncbi:hypothetical protein EYZ46_06570 [Salmonella enterica subsp. enterica]|nr:hypothetical protein [Salmonella enterica]EBG5496724.1 hypothetical protein [Salmonella enterica subsp. enterica serovar Lagos]EDI9890322.1 hypothetical protein [Salmonella enterica subsp. enterica]EAU3148839.1 hypothetical protein [Salmonella enterica]EBH8771164.1 hypothetical protein [Salmonella enterica subsp. enterica serovar Lagos]
MHINEMLSLKYVYGIDMFRPYVDKTRFFKHMRFTGRIQRQSNYLYTQKFSVAWSCNGLSS